MNDTAMPHESAVVALYSTHDEAEAAVRALQNAGVALTNVSVVGQGQQRGERVVGSFTLGDQRRHVGTHGGFWNAIWELLDDTGTFFVPGSGPIIVAGPVVGWLVRAAEGVEQLAHTVEGEPAAKRDAVASALIASGIPPADAHTYESAINSGQFLVVLHGDRETAKRAQSELERTGAAQVAAFGV
jgi:hypothetical protein